MHRIGIVAESLPGETRVAATPNTVQKLIRLGYEVVIEAGAGAGSSHTDGAYLVAGAHVVDRAEAWGSNVVVKINPPTSEEIGWLHDGATLIAMIGPALNPELVEELAARPITVLAMDAVPRISRAQSLDVLSSMANIAGYRAVIEAAHAFGRQFSGQVTAAGKIPAAKVLVAGAGVAGLAAIGAARSLGAIVRATDPRPEVAEEVASMGGEYLPVDVAQEISTDGYARATTEAYNARAAEIYAEQAADVDVIITTALIPGRQAPRLITAEHLHTMRQGSVVVDMAAAQGGNVEGSRPGEVVVTDNHVMIIGYTDLAARLPAQASQLFGTNVVNLIELLTPLKDGEIALDFDDPVQRSMTVVRDGEKTWPPPPVAVSAVPVTPPTAPLPVMTPPEPLTWRSDPRVRRYVPVAAIGLLLFLLNAFAPVQLRNNFTVFVLAIVIGYYVIGHVHHALHTPLMSVTNAISGIIVVGALLQIGHHDSVITVLSFVAILLASINIFGGFAVTRRMLSMFTRS
jgi:NAD(P) transhydrogenase subunit alpha